MRTIYIGGLQKNKKQGGSNWKIYMFLLFLMVALSSGLKVMAPTIAEGWINEIGANGKNGYAFSIREVELSLLTGEVTLIDFKMFNPKSNSELVEAPKVTLKLSLADFFMYHDKSVSILADDVDLILSKDFSSEMERITQKNKSDIFLDVVDTKIGHLNIIEQKADMSRTVLELNNVNVKVKNFTLDSINKKTEFTISSTIADGGKLNLTGKTKEENGRTPWSINGSLKDIPSDLFNKIAGDKLPFSFNESKLNAEITAQSDHGKVSGEILPDIKRLNLLEERPGIPTQTIARALNEELTFTLPFTLKDDLTLQYADTYRKLKTYRKYAATSQNADTNEVLPATQSVKPKKSSSFWPF